jgi:hypothetical protein
MVGTWEGDTGEIEIHSEKAGVIGSSGDFNSSTGDATVGTSGSYIFKTGYSDAGGNSGGVTFTTGYAGTGRAGGFHVYAGLTQGFRTDGADIDMYAGDTSGSGGNGGHVDIVAGDGEASAGSVTGGAGGHMRLEAGSGQSASASHVADGGDMFIYGGNSTSNVGGDVIIHTGKTGGTNSDLAKGSSAAESGSLFMRTPSIENPALFGYTGSINMGTGDSPNNEAGYVDIYAGSSLNLGAEINITAGAAHNTQPIANGDIEGGNIFVTGGHAYNSALQGTGGNITLEAGLAQKNGGNLMLYAGDTVTSDFDTGTTLCIAPIFLPAFRRCEVLAVDSSTDACFAGLLGQPSYSTSLNRLGGYVHIESGAGALKHSGHILMNTPDGGSSGGAGNITISTGDSNSGVDCGADGALTCVGGNMTISVGYNAVKHGAYYNLTGGDTQLNHGIGGPLLMEAGDGNSGVGGNVAISGGAGFNDPRSGNAIMTQANNPDWVQFGLADDGNTNGYGGNVSLSGGDSVHDHGGSVNLRSGRPGDRALALSGNITLITEDACADCITGTVAGPARGKSGNLELLTGEGELTSGNITLTTGKAQLAGGSSGNITLLAGESLFGAGGHINITAGRGKSLLEGGTLGGGDVRLDDGDLWLNAGRKVEVKGDFGTEILGGDALDRTFKQVHTPLMAVDA